MMTDEFPFTMRLLRGEDGMWRWLVVGHRNPAALIHPDDVVATSEGLFATAEEAVDDCRAKFGGEPSPDARDYRVWTEEKR